MRSLSIYFTAALLLSAMAPKASWAIVAAPLVTDPNFAPDGQQIDEFNLFGGSNIGVDDTAVFENNNIAVFTLNGDGFSGGGFSFGISNGENGIDSTEGGANIDAPNTIPVNQAIFDANFDPVTNPEGRLQNGNAIRISAWFQQDPNDPITIEPSVEPVLKLELWKEANSTNGDFTTGRAPFSGFGDRLWDNDINAPDPFFAGFGQSDASRIDINNDGDIANGDALTTSLPPATGAQWQLVENVLIIDDTPDDAGDQGFFWGIGEEQFDVSAVEEVRATLFVGDFAGQNLAGGGSFFLDNFLIEVFANEADLLATPNTNPLPVQDFVPGDYNNDGEVNAADFTAWRDNLGAEEGTLPNDVDGGEIGIAQYNTFVANFGQSLPGAEAAGSLTAIPEPTGVATLVASLLLGGLLRGRATR